MRRSAFAIVIILAVVATAGAPMSAAGGTPGVAGRDPHGEHTLYFAEGTTRAGYDEYVCIANPLTEKAVVTVEFLRQDAESVPTTVELAGRSRATVRALDVVGPGHDVAAVLSSASPFSAERPVYFSTAGLSGSHCVTGIAYPSEHWYFAEGCTLDGFEEYLCVLNPGDTEARLSLDVLGRPGTVVVGPMAKGLIVPPHSRRTIDVARVVGRGLEAGLEVSSMNGVPVISERVMYSTAPALSGGHCSAGLSLPVKRFDFAEGTTREGFREFLTLCNPGAGPIEVAATMMLGDGSERSASVPVAPRSRATLDVNAAIGPGFDVSVRLESDRPFCAERPVYFEALGTRDGHCSGGDTGASRRFVFAEGSTRAGFRPFVAVENAQETEVPVEVTYLVAGREAVIQRLGAPARSRITIDPVATLGEGVDFSLQLEAERPVVAERVQYCGPPSGFAGGTCSPGDTTFLRARFGDVRAYLNTYGEYAMSDLDDFERFDVAVLDPYDYPDESFPARLRGSGTLVLAYIDIGEVEDCRAYWPEVKKHPEVILAPNPDWPGCYYADVNNPEWHRIVLENAIPYLQSLGPMDGLCMDMLDTVDEYPELAPGMESLVREIREWYPDLLLMPNRGFSVLDRVLPSIDAFKYEELSSAYDFETGGYAYVDDESELDVLADALDRKDIPVFALDHVSTSPPDTGMARSDFERSAELAARLGRRFVWYANSVGQDHPYWSWLDYR